MFSSPSLPSPMFATARTMRLAMSSSFSLPLPPLKPATAALASFMASMSFTRLRLDSEKTGSRFSASLPVLATSRMPNLRHACWNARFLPGSPTVDMVSDVGETSTMDARKILASSASSVRCSGLALSFMSMSPRSTHILSVTFSTLRTFASLLICLMSFRQSLSDAMTTTVKIALSMFKPTASDSMLYPRLAKTPATRLIMPVSSAT
mmetsp:Transcript_2379/g.10882  ORF Transcript_2379/g.10882 Transcript_2379/m.10882 type:complete len:208 (-) Transcript_2379:387-1010(-)